MSNYDIEVKERFGGTSAYQEYEKKTAHCNADKWKQINDGLNAVFVKFAECMKDLHNANSTEAQELVRELQSHITENYYTCTNEILAGLGKMYVTDERFKSTLDKHGNGTAEFISKAIEIYCK